MVNHRSKEIFTKSQSPPSSAETQECVEIHLHSTNTSSWRSA